MKMNIPTNNLLLYFARVGCLWWNCLKESFHPKLVLTRFPVLPLRSMATYGNSKWANWIAPPRQKCSCSCERESWGGGWIWILRRTNEWLPEAFVGAKLQRWITGALRSGGDGTLVGERRSPPPQYNCEESILLRSNMHWWQLGLREQVKEGHHGLLLQE